MQRHRPAWLIVGTLSMSGIVSSIQSMMIIAQLPEVAGLYGVSPDDASWALTITLLTGAVATPILSRLADMFGKKRMVLISLLALVLGSACVVLPLGFGGLIVGRGLQGISVALVPIAISIMGDELPRDKLGFGIALMGTTLGLGGAIGMPLSGVMYDAFGFDSLFWFTGSLGVVMMLAVGAAVRDSPTRIPGRFDLFGAIVLALGLTGLLLGISKGATWGWTSLETLASFVCAAALFAIWFPTQLRTAVPMVDLRMAVRRPVLLTNTAAVASNMAMFANMVITAQMLHQPVAAGGFGLDPMETGLAMFPPALTWMALSAFSGLLLTRLGGRSSLWLGSALVVAAYAYRLLVNETVLDVIIGSCLVYLGSAIAFSAIPALIMASVPIAETASANGVNSLVRAIGSAGSSAVVGGVFAALAVPVAGALHPQPVAFAIALGFAGIAGAVALVVALFIPRRGFDADRDPGIPSVPER